MKMNEKRKRNENEKKEKRNKKKKRERRENYKLIHPDIQTARQQDKSRQDKMKYT